MVIAGRWWCSVSLDGSFSERRRHRSAEHGRATGARPRPPPVVDGWPRKDDVHVPDRSLTIEQVLALLAELRSASTRLPRGSPLISCAPSPASTSGRPTMCLPICVRALTSGATASRQSSPRTSRRSARSIPGPGSTGRGYPDQTFQPSLRAFTAQRASLLKLLEPLPHKDWSRAATVTAAGKPPVWSVLDYGRRMAGHERPHIKQIARTVNATHM